MSDASGGPVLVFDSGMGGLSVLRALRRSLPSRRFIYYADAAGFPYGELSEQRLRDRVSDILASAINRYSPAIVVIACNTASTIVLPLLRSHHQIPFVGTVPAIKPAAHQTRSGMISVLATPATISRDYTRDLISEHAGNTSVRLVGAPELAAIAERELAGKGVLDEEIYAQIGPCFQQHDGRRTDIVVLACTHFPLIENRLASLAPWPVIWLDPAPAIARRTLSLVGDGLDSAPPGPDLFLTTAEPGRGSSTPMLLSRYGLHEPDFDREL